jgi:dTDP-4-amino-4,6-dideoxygalactose transaminase
VNVPLLDLKAQYATIRSQVREAIDAVCDSQHFILGPEVESLEQEVASLSQVRFAIGVSSGTDALLIALMAIDLRPGDEVITTPYTFFATAGAIARLGAKPVFVDIDPHTYNIDADLIENAITPQTRAIIPVHLYGQMADMAAIMEVAHRRKVYVIEDAAQAIGSEREGRRAGSIGQLGCLSFFPSKNLGGFGDAGMVISNDSELTEKVKLLRNHGYSPKYYNKVVGGNFRLDAIQAAVLRVKLRYLDEWTAARQRNASIYRRLFREAGLCLDPADSHAHDLNASQRSLGQGCVAGIGLPFESPHCRHIYNQFVIRCDRRDQLAEYLKEHGIGTEVYYPVPMHLQECFEDLGYKTGDFPVSESAAKQTLALPIYPELTMEMMSTVANTIASFVAFELQLEMT